MSLFKKANFVEANTADINARVESLCNRQNLVIADLIRAIRPGISTSELAEVARKSANEAKVELSFKAKLSFPEEVAICLNHEIANCPPSADKVIKMGDLVKISLGTHDSFAAFSNQNWTVLVGEAPASKARILDSAKKCLDGAISLCKPGVLISAVVQGLAELARKENVVLSERFAGHMIGSEPIIQPLLTRQKGIFSADYVLQEDVALSMFVLAHPAKPNEAIREDKWSIYDKEKFPSVCFSHVLKIETHGAKILTNEYRIFT